MSWYGIGVIIGAWVAVIAGMTGSLHLAVGITLGVVIEAAGRWVRRMEPKQ
jgi:hypothetical protein